MNIIQYKNASEAFEILRESMHKTLRFYRNGIPQTDYVILRKLNKAHTYNALVEPIWESNHRTPKPPYPQYIVLKLWRYNGYEIAADK